MSTTIYTIYCATNTTNNKKYVGYTCDFNTRKAQHISAAGNKPKTHFHKALNKYKFTWDILCECDNQQEALHYWEEHYIRLLDTYALNGKGYNYSYGGDGAGHIKTAEHRRKISETNKRKGINWATTGASEAARIAITGKPQSAEHKLKRAASKCREIEIGGITYRSGKEAALSLGLSNGCISGWVKNNNGSRYNITIPTGSNGHVRRYNNNK